MEIRKSSEDYLETMLMLKEQNGYVHSIDIAKHLNVTKPSVSYATKRLRENGYIEMNNDGLITLTDSGMAIAHKILDRHKMLSQFLIMLGVDKDVADEDACNIEHDISNESFEAICNHVNNFMSECRESTPSHRIAKAGHGNSTTVLQAFAGFLAPSPGPAAKRKHERPVSSGFS